MDTIQTGILFHLVNLGMGGPQEDIPLSRLEEIGKVRQNILTRCWLPTQRPLTGSRDPLIQEHMCLTTTTARFRLSNLLRSDFMDDEVLHLAAVHAAVAKRRTQDRVVDNASVIRRVGTCFGHTDISPVQPCAILY